MTQEKTNIFLIIDYQHLCICICHLFTTVRKKILIVGISTKIWPENNKVLNCEKTGIHFEFMSVISKDTFFRMIYRVNIRGNVNLQRLELFFKFKTKINDPDSID